jgi:hypothetical protein
MRWGVAKMAPAALSVTAKPPLKKVAKQKGLPLECFLLLFFQPILKIIYLQREYT